MSNKENTEAIYDVDATFKQLDVNPEVNTTTGQNYLNDDRYAILGSLQEQWSFVHSLSVIGKQRFKEPDFEATLVEGVPFCLYNSMSRGAIVKVDDKRVVLTAQEVGFIIGYRLSLAKNMKALSDSMYLSAKTILSKECFADFFLMIDWKKVNFYSLFEIVLD